MSISDLRLRKPDEVAQLERAAKVYDDCGKSGVPIVVFQNLYRLCKKHDVTQIGGHELQEGPPMRSRAKKRPPESLL